MCGHLITLIMVRFVGVVITAYIRLRLKDYRDPFDTNYGYFVPSLRSLLHILQPFKAICLQFTTPNNVISRVDGAFVGPFPIFPVVDPLGCSSAVIDAVTWALPAWHDGHASKPRTLPL